MNTVKIRGAGKTGHTLEENTCTIKHTNMVIAGRLEISEDIKHKTIYNYFLKVLIEIGIILRAEAINMSTVYTERS